MNRYISRDLYNLSESYKIMWCFYESEYRWERKANIDRFRSIWGTTKKGLIRLIKNFFIRVYLEETVNLCSNEEFEEIVKDYKGMMIYFEGVHEENSYYSNYFEKWFHIGKIYVDDDCY